MASWINVGRQTKNALSALSDLGSRRSFVSRAYYAAYAVVTGHLAAVAPPGAPFGRLRTGTPRANPAHRDLRRLVTHHLSPVIGPMRVALLNTRLSVLYNARIEADYQPTREFSTQDVATARRALMLVFRLLGEVWQ